MWVPGPIAPSLYMTRWMEAGALAGGGSLSLPHERGEIFLPARTSWEGIRPAFTIKNRKRWFSRVRPVNFCPVGGASLGSKAYSPALAPAGKSRALARRYQASMEA